MIILKIVLIITISLGGGFLTGIGFEKFINKK